MKWKDLHELSNTWEPMEYLDPKLIQIYEERGPDQSESESESEGFDAFDPNNVEKILSRRIINGKVRNDHIISTLCICCEYCEYKCYGFCACSVRCLQVEYLLKWKDVLKTGDSWEPAENLDCLELIQMFEDA